MGGFARTCSEVGLPIPCSILPMGGFCPNLPEDSFRSSLIPSFIPHPSFRRVVLARTCPKFVLLILHPSSLILPSDGWFLPELARIRSAHPSSLILPSDGWFLPELARKSVCSSFIPCIPHPSFRRVVLARTCSEIRSAHPSSIILPSDGWFCPNLLEIRSAHPSSFIPHPSDGWFLPELARNSVRQAPSDPG